MAETEHRPTNFIRQIIDKDLANGVHDTIKTRFPPEPNGFLHIGHAKSICLNFGIAQDYKGLCNLRFDDTNPEKEDIDYVRAIEKDVSWLGFEWAGDVHYSSDYFDQLHGYEYRIGESHIRLGSRTLMDLPFWGESANNMYVEPIPSVLAVLPNILALRWIRDGHILFKRV